LTRNRLNGNAGDAQLCAASGSTLLPTLAHMRVFLLALLKLMLLERICFAS
jgi:hypothetical protein